MTIKEIINSTELSHKAQAIEVYKMGINIFFEGQQIKKGSEEAKYLRAWFKKQVNPVDASGFWATKSGNDCLCHALDALVLKAEAERSERYADACSERTTTPRKPRKPRTPKPTVSTPVVEEVVTAPVSNETQPTGARHERYDEIKSLLKVSADLGMGVMLVGPAGTGKTSLCIDLANELGLEFRYDTNVQKKSELVGYTLDTYHESNLYHCMKFGGVYLADEFDTWDNENCVTIMNNIIAQRFYTFPNGETVHAHKDFYIMAAANTIGKGADDMYCDRHQLDEATLTRFFLEEVGYDRKVELEIAKGNVEMVDFIDDLREAVNTAQLGFAIGYRDLKKLHAIENMISDLSRAVELATLRGMAKDDVKMIANNLKTDNKYAKAFKKIA